MGQTTTAEYVLFLQGDDLSSAATYDFECPANHFSVKIGVATNQANVLVIIITV